MRNKKSFLSLGLFVLILFLGVGYAVVSSVYFKVKGTAGAANSSLNVEITNAVASTTVADKTVDFNHVLSNKNLTSNFTLNEMELNEMVTITYTVTNNESSVDAVLTSANNGVILTSSNSDYFRVNFSIIDSSTDIENNDRTMTVLIFVELIKTPVSAENGSTTVELTLLASPSSTLSQSNVGSTFELTPVRFGEKYYYISFWGVDVKDKGWWISFNEDGTIDSIESGAGLTYVDGYIYSKTDITNSNADLLLSISDDGKFLINNENFLNDSTGITSTFVAESDYDFFSSLSLQFFEKYICTTDNSDNSNSSNLDTFFRILPDGGMIINYNDGEIRRYSAGTFTFTQNEIQSSELPEGTKLIVSSDGKTITQTYNDQVIYVYTNVFEMS